MPSLVSLFTLIITGEIASCSPSPLRRASPFYSPSFGASTLTQSLLHRLLVYAANPSLLPQLLFLVVAPSSSPSSIAAAAHFLSFSVSLATSCSQFRRRLHLCSVTKPQICDVDVDSPSSLLSKDDDDSAP
ncbi:hypothetical protein S83_019809 [Arachis hypogaea]